MYPQTSAVTHCARYTSLNKFDKNKQTKTNFEYNLTETNKNVRLPTFYNFTSRKRDILYIFYAFRYSHLHHSLLD